jgi:hypothetical protein
MNTVCQECAVRFESKTGRRKYCSGRCAVSAWRRQNPEAEANIKNRHLATRKRYSPAEMKHRDANMFADLRERGILD